MRTIAALTALLLCIAGQAQTVNVCDRTPQVRDAVMEAVDADACHAVDSDKSVAGMMRDLIDNIDTLSDDAARTVFALVLSLLDRSWWSWYLEYHRYTPNPSSIHTAKYGYYRYHRVKVNEFHAKLGLWLIHSSDRNTLEFRMLGRFLDTGKFTETAHKTVLRCREHLVGGNDVIFNLNVAIAIIRLERMGVVDRQRVLREMAWGGVANAIVAAKGRSFSCESATMAAADVFSNLPLRLRTDAEVLQEVRRMWTAWRSGSDERVKALN